MKIIKKTIPFIIAGGILAGSIAIAAETPKLYRLSQYKGEIGDKIRVKGINFGKHEGEIIFDGADKVNVENWKDKRIIFHVPDVAEGKTYKVRICRKNGECTKYQKFYVKRTGPELWRIKNLSDKNNYKGVPGDRLKLTGLNFDSKNIAVKFSGANAEILERTKKTIYVRVPDLARDKAYSVYVTDGNHDSNSQNFYIKP